VDDSPAFLSAARAFLESRGLEVVGAARSAAEGLTAVSTLEPDLVLMDLHMPGMTGLEATRAIKKTTPGIYVVIVSLDGDWWQRQDVDDPVSEADGFISKSRFTEMCPLVIARLFRHLHPQSSQGIPDLS
jgi:DNA-binding NarL/FixJ family response regulator